MRTVKKIELQLEANMPKPMDQHLPMVELNLPVASMEEFKKFSDLIESDEDACKAFVRLLIPNIGSQFLTLSYCSKGKLKRSEVATIKSTRETLCPLR